MTHMVIARELNKHLQKGIIKDMDLFYLGNLAPDSIHAREGYLRIYKKHTHLRDDIPDKDFGKEENLVLFHERVTRFILENRDSWDGLEDLYRGYVVHILTDELFVLTIREEFNKTVEKLGIIQGEPIYIDYIITDMIRNDYLLVKNYEGMDEIRRQIEGVPIYPIRGYLTEKEMSISRDWMVRQYFYEENQCLQPRYITYERILTFIQLSVENIINRLSEGGSLPRMF